MEETTQLLQMFVSKGKKACQFLCRSLEMCCPLSIERLIDCSAFRCSPEENPTGAVTADMTRPSPTYIINIQHSTLNNCVFGNGNYQSVTAEQQPLMQSPMTETNEPIGGSCTTIDQQMAVQTTHSSSAVDVDVHSSHLRYVIIGDQNSMLVNTGLPEEKEMELEET